MEWASVGRSLAALLIGYVRWTQIVPMLIGWAILFLGLFLYWMVNFQDAGLSVLERALTLWARFEWLPAIFSEASSGESSSLSLDMEGLRGLVVTLWTGLSLVFFLLGLARTAIFGPAPPRTFRRKLLLVAAMGLCAWVAFTGIYLLSSEPHSGRPLQWVLMFGLWCSLIIVVSVYSLAVSHGLGWVLDRLEEFDAPPRRVPALPVE